MVYSYEKMLNLLYKRNANGPERAVAPLTAGRGTVRRTRCPGQGCEAVGAGPQVHPSPRCGSALNPLVSAKKKGPGRGCPLSCLQQQNLDTAQVSVILAEDRTAHRQPRIQWKKKEEALSVPKRTDLKDTGSEKAKYRTVCVLCSFFFVF